MRRPRSVVCLLVPLALALIAGCGRVNDKVAALEAEIDKLEERISLLEEGTATADDTLRSLQSDLRDQSAEHIRDIIEVRADAVALRTRIGSLVPNPEASFRFSPRSPVESGAVLFDSSAVDYDGTIERFEWIFPDGSLATGQTVSFTFREAGAFAVTHRVWDDAGLFDELAQTVTVQAKPRCSGYVRVLSIAELDNYDVGRAWSYYVTIDHGDRQLVTAPSSQFDIGERLEGDRVSIRLSAREADTAHDDWGHGFLTIPVACGLETSERVTVPVRENHGTEDPGVEVARFLFEIEIGFTSSSP